MNSFNSSNAYTRPNQFRPWYQPEPTAFAQDQQNLPLPSNGKNPSQPHTASPSLKASRPHSISELAEMAKQSLGDDARPFKAWLRKAENARRDALRLKEQGDLEPAFAEFTKAVTILLEKIPSHSDYRVLLTLTQRHNIRLHGQEMLDRLAEIKLPLMERYEQWRENTSSARFQSTSAPVSHLPPQRPVSRSGVQSHGADTPSSSSTPSSPRSRASMLRSRTPSPYRQSPVSRDLGERFKEVDLPVPPLAAVGSSQNREPPDVANVPSTNVASASDALEVTTKVLNEDEVSLLETYSFIYSPGPSFVSSDTNSITSYKTEKSVNSRKSRYNALPRRKYADVGERRLPPGLLPDDVDEASASVPKSELSGESLPSLLDTIPIAPKANLVEESRPHPGTQPLDRPLKIHGSSIYGLSIVNTALQLERAIDCWATKVLRITPAPLTTLRESVLTDITDVGEGTALFTDVRPMTVQSLLRHALAQVISDGIINSLIVTNSTEENLGLTHVHERLLTRNVATAAIWRRHTFSIAVEFLSPEMMRAIFEQNMPLLAALLPDCAEDAFGARDVLEDAFKFSCMLRGANADADALYRSFIPKLASTLNPGRVEIVNPCRRSQRGEVDSVGVTIFPGLIEVLPTPPVVQKVVRRAKVICECELLAASHPVLTPPLPPLPLMR